MSRSDPSGNLPTDLESILTEVLRLGPAEQVPFIAQVCGADKQLRRKVEKALIAHPAAEFWGEGAPLTLSWDLGSDADPSVVDELLHATHESTGDDARGDAVVPPPEPSCALGPGAQLSHYRLERKIGQGGMGEVYRARDLALGRDVAIKILRDLVDPSLRARLAREANAGARLDHAAVATFIEFAHAEGIDYLAMEFVEGETLRTRLQRGPMEVDEALAFAKVLLEALVFAHSMGILHRDIKPENIMLTPEGGVKLLDFGVAKDVTLAEDETLLLQSQARTVLETMQGAVVGTPGYMSPEQVRGEEPLPASDVFGLGVVLHEVICGARPFRGDNRMSLMLSVLTQDPPSIPHVSPQIDAVLKRALARELSQRYGSAREFLEDLKQLDEGISVAALPKSLALLDFENLRGESEHDWIGSGVVESLAVDLRRVQGLEIVPREKVQMARSAMLRHADQDDAEGSSRGGGPESRIDPAALGLAVRARWILAGTFQHAGDALRMTARLIEVATARDLWSEKLDGSLDTVLQMQDELAARIAESLDVIVPHEERGPRRRELDAFECYQRALQLWGRFTRAAVDEMMGLLQHAIELDPEYAEAYALLAKVYAPSRWMQTTDPEDLEHCIRYATQAIELDPDAAEAHVSLGYGLWRSGDVEAAIEEEKLAAQLDPSSYGSYFEAACYCELGDFERALEASQRHYQHLALTPNLMLLGFEHMQLENVAEARWVFEQALRNERDPNAFGWQGAMQTRAELERRYGELAAARAICMESMAWIERSDLVLRTPVRMLTFNVLGRICRDQGDRDAARAAFEQAESLSRTHPNGVSVGQLRAQALAGLSQVDRERRRFDEAVELFEDRQGWDFSWFGLGGDVTTSADLAAAAAILGDHAAERAYRARSIALGMPSHLLERA